MKITLFGFTGLGNAVLRGLMNADDIKVNSVFTKKYDSPYPYYPEVQIEDFCKDNKIDCYTDRRVNSKEVVDLLKNEKPDLIIVASFSQIISEELIQIPKAGIINVHPSLLPKYRGPYPDRAVLLNDEKVTGVTFHYLTEILDSGNIILQRPLNILPRDNNSTLKKKLADLTEEMIPGLIELFKTETAPAGKKQNENDSTFFPKPKPEDGYLENENDPDIIKNKIRALNPFPGTSFLINGKRKAVDDYEILKQENKIASVAEEPDHIDIHFTSCSIRLFKKK